MFGNGLTVENARQVLPQIMRDAELNPTVTGCQSNLASVLFTLGRVKESIPIYQKCMEMDRKEHNTFINAGMAYKEEGEFGKSTKAIEYAFQADPDNFYYKLGWAESLLRAGYWRQAWPLYEEARITKSSAKNEMLCPPQLGEWHGERVNPDTNATIVVYGEGGIGDRICYSRWLPEITRQKNLGYIYFPDTGITNNPSFSCFSLFKNLSWAHAKEVDGQSIEVVGWTTNFALPACFEAIPTTIPKFESPLTPPVELVASYRKQFSTTPHPVLAISWNAGEKFEGDRKFRSLTIEQVARLVNSCPGYTWVNGSGHETMGIELKQPFINPRPWQTWEHTAAILAACDGVISVDTGPMHVAGAMGSPLWILLSANSCWKYLKNTEKCYWYPQARLFRNQGWGFENAIDQVIGALNRGEYPCRQHSLLQ